MSLCADVQTKTAPSVNCLSAVSPSSKSVSRPRSAIWTSGASGSESIAVTKIDRGRTAGSATREKGRARSAVQRPDSSRSALTPSSPSSAGDLPENDRNATCASSADPSSAPTVTTTDWRDRRAPRLIEATTPAAGEVWRTPGSFRSSNSSWPRRTVSPTATCIVGRRPT